MSQQNKPVRMRRLMGWGVAGQLAFLASQLLTLVALTRLTGLEEVGAISLASAVVIPVFFFFNLGMRVNFASGAGQDIAFRDYRALLTVSVIVGYAVILAIALLAFSELTLILLLILGVAKAAECLSELAYGVFQRHDRMHLVALSLAARGFVSTLALGALLLSGAEVWVAFIGQMAVWVAMMVFVDMPLARRIADGAGDTATASPRRMRLLAGASGMLALNGVLSSLHGNMPRYVIASQLGVAALGAFAVLGYAMQAVSTLVSAVVQSMVARLSTYIGNAQSTALRLTLMKLTAVLILLGAVSVSVSLWIGDWVIEAVFGPLYADLGGLLAICMLAATLGSGVLSLQVFVLAARQFGTLLAIRVASIVAMLVCTVGGGMLAGLAGVIWGICLAHVLHLLALAVPVRTVLRSGPVAMAGT